MPYNKLWGSTHPGCIIFLLDQSGSMNDDFGGTQIGAGRRKCDMVATVLNSFLNELIATNTVGPMLKPRADIAVLGYGGSGARSALGGALTSKSFVSLTDLRDNPIRMDMRTRKEIDDTGQIFELPVYFPEWVDAVADGGTPMCEALRQARGLADQWAAGHPDNYPPVIINVTDGASTDGDPTAVAQDLCRVSTNDGEALLFNCHITHLNDPEVAYPSSEGELPNDPYARLLFAISSIIPESARNGILQATQNQKALPVGARAMVFNGDAASVKDMFTFASINATVPLPLDLNR